MAVCSKCGGTTGPFVSANICKKCRAAEKAAWYQRRKAGADTSWEARRTPERQEAARERRRQQQRARYAATAAQQKQRVRRWQHTHPERVRAANRRSYARRQADPERHKAWNAYHREYRRKQKLLSPEQIGESDYDPNDGFLAFLMESETD